MKRNVDLTENRDFNENNGLVGIGDFLHKESWEDIQNQLILTGNANERNNKKMSLSFCVPDNFCDCCGNTKPWDFYGSSLCCKCEELYRNKIVWRRLKEVEREFNSRW